MSDIHAVDDSWAIMGVFEVVFDHRSDEMRQIRGPSEACHVEIAVTFAQTEQFWALVTRNGVDFGV